MFCLLDNGWRGKQIKGNLFTLALVLLLSLGAVAPPPGQVEAGPGTIYVPDDYPAIQEAVNASTPGDTIIVRDGSYAGNIAVTRDHLTIQSQHGAASTIVAAANPDKPVFQLAASWVNLTGFTVVNATGEDGAGIYLGDRVEHGAISGNIARNNYYGIVVSQSSNNTLTNNTANGNSQDGIILLGTSTSNTLTGNTADENGCFGIHLYFSGSGNTLRHNSMSRNRFNFFGEGLSPDELRQDVDISNTVDGKPVYYLVDESSRVIDSSTNAGYVAAVNSTSITVKDLALTHSGVGVFLAYTDNCRIENVTAGDNRYGFILFHSSNSTLAANTATGSTSDGILLGSSDNNTLVRNTADSCGNNIHLEHSSNNTLINNTASRGNNIHLESSSNNTLINNTASRGNYGICSQDSSNNIIYLNSLVNNTRNAFSASSNDTWESPLKLIYTYNGGNYTRCLGNYWGDYRDKYPRARERGSTGVWKTPYSIVVADHAVLQADSSPLAASVSRYLVTGGIPIVPSWLSRYWWTLVVAGVIIALLLLYFLLP